MGSALLLRFHWHLNCSDLPVIWNESDITMRPYTTRSIEINRLRNRLERDDFPRLQMSFLVTITGAAGFLTSFLLLRAGLHQMSWRYLLACTIAYLVFLLLLWLWLRTKAEDYADVIPDALNSIPSPGHGGAEFVRYAGKGGEFGGGGANASFDDAAVAVAPDTSAADGVVGEALGSAGAAGELAIPLFVLMLLAGLILSSLYVVYSAPILFAELLLDGLLAAGLYRRLRGVENRHWLESALSRTIWPFILTALLSFVAGWAMGQYAPEADSLGTVLHHIHRVD